jgi:hypothetical protein
MKFFKINNRHFYLNGSHLEASVHLDVPKFVGTIDPANGGFFIVVGEHEEFCAGGKKGAVARMVELFEKTETN